MDHVRELALHPAARTGAATLVAYLLILVSMTLLVFGVPYLIISGL